MKFDDQGHVLLSPLHVQAGLEDQDSLTTRWLLPGTPHIFDTYDNYHRFLTFIADELYIPPMNICTRGSGKIGFSIAPRAEKVWMAASPTADVDVGIVDVDYFNVINRELKRWQRSAGAEEARDVAKRVSKTGRHEYYRYFDLPDAIQVVAQHNSCFRRANEVVPCVNGRVVTAFIFRDWWSVCRRYKFDLDNLKRGLKRDTDPLPAATGVPRAYQPPSLGVGDDED